MSELHLKMSKLYLNTVWKEIPGEDFGYEGIVDGLRVGFSVGDDGDGDKVIWCWVKGPVRPDGPHRDYSFDVLPSQNLFEVCARIAFDFALQDVFCYDGVLAELRGGAE